MYEKNYGGAYMKPIRDIYLWLTCGKKEIPEEVRRFLKEISETKTVYQRDMLPNYFLERLVNEYVNEEVIDKIAKEIKTIQKLSKERVDNEPNVLLIRVYYGQSIATYHYTVTGFAKIRNHWKHLGNQRDYEMSRLPRAEEVFVEFIDEHGKKKQDNCQKVLDFYYEY